MARTMVIFGASRGLGAAFGLALADAGDMVWLVSRSKPDLVDRVDGIERRWIAADLSKPESAAVVREALGDAAIDVLLYNAGVWEQDAFSDAYDFERVPPQENAALLQINLMSAVTCIQALLPNLRRTTHAKIILIGSTSGLENHGGHEVAYVASKFGLRGVAHALREELRPDGIAVTCVNPGSFDTGIPYEAGPEAVIERYGMTQMPMQDLVAIVRCVISLSAATCVKEIDVPAMADTSA